MKYKISLIISIILLFVGIVLTTIVIPAIASLEPPLSEVNIISYNCKVNPIVGENFAGFVTQQSFTQNTHSTIYNITLTMFKASPEPSIKQIKILSPYYQFFLTVGVFFIAGGILVILLILNLEYFRAYCH